MPDTPRESARQRREESSPASGQQMGIERQLKLVHEAPVRVGVVGCGVVSSYGHIPAIANSPLAELVAVADPNEERREAEANKHDVPCFSSFEEMVDAVELDAVAIPTQPDVRLELVRIAAEHGLHVFCEKPLSDTAEQAQEILRLMSDAGLFAGVAFVYRGKQVVQRMMELLRQGAIGRLRAVHIENLWDYHGLRDAQVRGDRRRRALRNLGTLDCGVHDIDLARYFAGAEFGPIQAIGATIEKDNVFPDHLAVQSVMQNGVMVTVEESAVWGHTAKERPRYEQSYRLVGENGILSAQSGDPVQGQKIELRVVSGEDQWVERIGTGKNWEGVYDQFFRVILGQPVEHRFIADARDGLVNMCVACEVIEQIQRQSG